MKILWNEIAWTDQYVSKFVFYLFKSCFSENLF